MKMETRSDGDAERTGGIYLVGPVGLDTDRVTNPSWFVWDFLIFITQVLRPRKPSVPGASGQLVTIWVFWQLLIFHPRVCPVGIEELRSHFLLFSCSVVSNSLRPHGLQHAKLPCPSPAPWACSNSWPLCRWCHPTISYSVIPFSSCLRSFPGSGYFPMSRFFTSDGQSIRVSASTSVLPMNIQDWFPLGWTSWVS